MDIEEYPGIKRVALELARDNGIINRLEPASEFLTTVSGVLEDYGMSEEDLSILNEFCVNLDEEQVSILAGGEETEMDEVANRCPKPELCELFDAIFDAA